MFNNLIYAFKRKNNRAMEKNDITIEQLNNMLINGAVLIDVRSPQEYNEGHIEGSILIPEYELRARINEIAIYKKEIVIVYCSTGSRSKKAQRILNRLGFEYVYNLYNGIDNY